MASRIQKQHWVGAYRFVLAGGGADDLGAFGSAHSQMKGTISTPAMTALGSISSFAS